MLIGAKCVTGRVAFRAQIKHESLDELIHHDAIIGLSPIKLLEELSSDCGSEGSLSRPKTAHVCLHAKAWASGISRIYDPSSAEADA